MEKPECIDARQTVKELYSFHFGNDMKPSKENLQLREKFLTDTLKQQLEKQTEGARDYFTATEDFPKAFRIGGCNVIEPNKKLNLQVLLFWKDDNRNEQREVKVEVIKENDTWLINKVEN
ncbi:MAG: YbjP/YqhG family protein [Acidobacteria bacterium]|nr:YbjP/YqhG family protein [Acidobacteriota bacterium]